MDERRHEVSSDNLLRLLANGRCLAAPPGRAAWPKRQLPSARDVVQVQNNYPFLDCCCNSYIGNAAIANQVRDRFQVPWLRSMQESGRAGTPGGVSPRVGSSLRKFC